MSTAATIRPARQEDADSVLALAQGFATTFVVESNAFHRAFVELLSSPACRLAVAEANAKVVGYVLAFDHYTFYANRRVTWVEEIAVHENYRKKDIGMLLMQSVGLQRIRRLLPKSFVAC